MCDLVTALAVAGSGMSALGAIRQGQAQANSDNFNAEIARRDALSEKDAAVQQAEKIRRVGKRTQSEATSALAASGVQLDEGSAILIDQQIAQDVEQDAFMELLTGDRRARQLNSQAELFKASAKNAKTSSRMAAATSLLSAGASGYSGWKAAAGARGASGGTNVASGVRINRDPWGNV